MRNRFYFTTFKASVINPTEPVREILNFALLDTFREIKLIMKRITFLGCVSSFLSSYNRPINAY